MSVPETGGALASFAAGRLPSVALALAGMLVVYLNPGSTAVLLAAVLIVGGGVYRTSRSPERGHHGLSKRIVDEHRLLVEIIENAPIPFAVYDRDDYLIVCNESYEKLYGGVFDDLRSRQQDRRIHYADLVRAFSADSVPADKLDAYVADRCRAQRAADGTAVDRMYPGFGWLRVTKFATPAGGIAGFAVDINELKEREKALNAQIERSRTLEQKLRALADTDSLTGLANRRAFIDRLEAEYVRAGRGGHSLSVIMMDIDSFKAVNDRHGHGFGDLVIRRLAAAARAELRARVDFIGRLGGEEFAMVLPETDSEGARRCAERIRESIGVLEFEAGDERPRVTASFGVADVSQADCSYRDCLNRADTALYRAKSRGRNRVVAWRPPDSGEEVSGYCGAEAKGES